MKLLRNSERCFVMFSLVFSFLQFFNIIKNYSSDNLSQPMNNVVNTENSEKVRPNVNVANNINVFTMEFKDPSPSLL